jgi:phosphatidylinositol glycan class V
MGWGLLSSHKITFIVCIAALSRLLLIGIGVTATLLVPSYDSSSQIAHYPRDDNVPYTEYVLKLSLAGFSNWDGMYFHHIARHSYPHEQFYAFFPGYPSIVNLVSEYGSVIQSDLDVH